MEFVLSVAATGSVAAAARALGVNHTTVLRRVQAFEKTLNIRIFERLRTGYRPTPEGEIFLDAARAIEATVTDLDRKIAGSDTALQGPLSITSTDTIIAELMDDVARFQRRHPGIILDVTVANDRLNLDRRESDIAIRASANPPAHLVGRRICDLRFGIYASPAATQDAEAVALEKRPWVGLAPPILGSVAGEWMTQMVPASQVALRTNSFANVRTLAEEGVGHALLPRFVGDASGKLTRIEDGEKMPVAGLWLLSHADILRSPRVRAATDFLFEALRAKRARFEGEA